MNKNVFCTNNVNKLLGHRLIYRKYCKSGFWMISTKIYTVKKKPQTKETSIHIFSEWTKKKKTGFHVKNSILHSQQISRLIFKMRFRLYQTPHECIKNKTVKSLLFFNVLTSIRQLCQVFMAAYEQRFQEVMMHAFTF